MQLYHVFKNNDPSSSEWASLTAEGNSLVRGICMSISKLTIKNYLNVCNDSESSGYLNPKALDLFLLIKHFGGMFIYPHSLCKI